MSKLALFVAVPAAVGLAAWNVSLQSELAELRERMEPHTATVAEPAAQPDTRSPADAPRPPRETVKALQQVQDLSERLAQVETRLPAPPKPPVPGEPETTVAEASPAEIAAYSSDVFKSAVTRVLDEREEQRRRERIERSAEQRANFLLRDTQATDDQRAAVRKLLVEQAFKIDALRQDESVPEEERRQQINDLQSRQVESLSAVLDAATLEQVRRRTTLRRGGEGLPPRGPDEARPRRGDGAR